MRTLLYIFLSLALFLNAQGEQFSLRDFGSGLNGFIKIQNFVPSLQFHTETGPFGNGPIGLRSRNGYAALSDTINGNFELTGIFGSVDRAGLKTMYGVIDTMIAASTLRGLGGLFASADFAYNLDTSLALYPYVYTGVTPFFTQWKNDIFMSNGRQKPLIIHNDSARDLVVQSPGEPRLYPMNRAPTTTIGPNGEYRYIYVIESNCGSEFGTDSLQSVGRNDNGDMEDWTGGDPDHWIEVNAITTQETDTVHGGASSCRLGFGSTVSALLLDTIAVTGGEQYRIAAWFNNDTTPTGGVVPYGIRITARPSGTIVGEFYENDSTSGWEEVTLYVDVPLSGEDSLVILIHKPYSPSFAGSPLYIDDVSLQRVEGQNYQESYQSQPVRAYNEPILHTNMEWMAFSAACDTSDAEFDTVKVLSVYRTRAYPGTPLTVSDTMWRVASFNNLTVDIIDTLKFIDSIPDDSLGLGSFSGIHIPDFAKLGRSDDGTITGVRVGAPTYISRNDTASAPSCVKFGDEDDDSLSSFAVAYMITYKDTLTGIESDSSRNLYIYLDTVGTSAVDSNFVIGIPPIPSGRDHLVRILYKAFGLRVDVDTTAGNLTIRIDTIKVWNEPGDDSKIRVRSRFHGTPPDDTLFIPVNRLDTLFQNYFQLALITDSATRTYYDSLSPDTLSLRQTYIRDAAPNGLTGITLDVDRLIGYEGSKLYWSRLDTAFEWGSLNFLGLGMDDGDEGTAIVTYQNHVKFYTNNSQYLIIPTGDPFTPYEREKVISGIGCIAPHSIVAYLNDLYYLSRHGFIRESAIPHRENTSNLDTISTFINDLLLNHSSDVLRSVVGVAVPKENEIRWSFPDLDTTFVYNTLTRTFWIYDYSFSQAVFYDTTKDASIEPATDLLFIQKNSDVIYIEHDSIAADKGRKIHLSLKAGPIARNREWEYKTVSKMGVLFNPASIDSFFTTNIYDHRDTAVIYTSADTVTDVYDTDGLGSKSGNYFYIEIDNIVDDTTEIGINGIDIWTLPAGPVDVE